MTLFSILGQNGFFGPIRHDESRLTIQSSISMLLHKRISTTIFQLFFQEIIQIITPYDNKAIEICNCQKTIEFRKLEEF